MTLLGIFFIALAVAVNVRLLSDRRGMRWADFFAWLAVLSGIAWLAAQWSTL